MKSENQINKKKINDILGDYCRQDKYGKWHIILLKGETAYKEYKFDATGNNLKKYGRMLPKGSWIKIYSEPFNKINLENFEHSLKLTKQGI